MNRARRRAPGSVPVAVLCVLAAGALAIGQVHALASMAAVFWIGGFALMAVALVISLARRRGSRDSRG